MTAEGTSIACPTFGTREVRVGRLTAQINAARTVAEKAPFAQEVIDALRELLACEAYGQSSLDCICCLSFCELWSKTARLILRVNALTE